MSIDTPSRFRLFKALRHQLRKLPLAVKLWRRLKTTALVSRYYGLRFIGNALYPFLGNRVPLRGYYARTRDFLQRSDGHYIDMGSLSRTDGSTPSDSSEPEIFVAVMPRARSLYDYGVVVSPDHKLLADVSWEGYDPVSLPLDHPAMHNLCFPQIQRIRGKVAVITSLNPHNYYHWMFDILPRFAILQASGLSPDHYLVNAKALFQRESLQVLRIPLDRILDPTNKTHIEADELIVPSLPGPAFHMSPQPRACQYLRSMFLRNDQIIKPLIARFT